MLNDFSAVSFRGIIHIDVSDKKVVNKLLQHFCHQHFSCQQSRENRNFQFSNLQSTFESQEEKLEEQVEEVVHSRRREQEDDDDDNLQGLLDLMKMMIERSHNLFSSMMDVLNNFA